MTTTYVSNGTALSTAINAASDGDTIICNDGNYGSLTLASKLFSSVSPLTIQAANRNGATFTGQVKLNGCSGFVFDGMNFNGGFSKDYGTTSYITLQYCYVTGVIHFTSTSNSTIQYCEVEAAGTYVDGNSHDITIQENYFHDRAGDMINITGAAYNIDVLNNVMYDLWINTYFEDPHWDLCLQMFSVGGVAPSAFNIRGNIVIDNPTTRILRMLSGVPTSDGESQGIFCGNGGGTYLNGIIEQNLVWVQNANGIRFTNTGTGCEVRNNSFINGNILVNQSSSSWSYSLPVTDNICPAVGDEGAGGGASPTLSGNVQFGGTPSSAYDDPNPTNGDLDYRRFISSTYPTKGAATRIAEIQAGTNVYALTLAGMDAVGGATPAAPSIPGLPTISGSEAVNQILTATPSTPVTGYPTPTRTYLWYNSVSGLVQDSASNTYQLQASDEGDQIYVVQREENATDVDTAQSSNTGTIAAAPTAPAVSSFSPTDNATDVALDTLLTITFDTTMALGTGTINLWRPDDGIVDTWDVVANAGTGDHTVHADGNDIILQGWAAWPMHSGVTYSILIDNGALESAGGVAFPGIADTTTWNFTTIGATPPDLGHVSLGSGAVIHLNGALLLI